MLVNGVDNLPALIPINTIFHKCRKLMFTY